MSTKIKRLPFAMLYCEARSENEDYRKESAKMKLRSSPTTIESRDVLGVEDYCKKTGIPIQ